MRLHAAAAHNSPKARRSNCLPAARCHTRASVTNVRTKLQPRELVSFKQRIRFEQARRDPEGQTLLTADAPPNAAITRFTESDPHALSQLSFKKPHTSNASDKY